MRETKNVLVVNNINFDGWKLQSKISINFLSNLTCIFDATKRRLAVTCDWFAEVQLILIVVVVHLK